MLGEEGTINAFGGGLLGDGLHAVLAILAEVAAAVRVWPGTAGAIEAVLLVQLVEDTDAIEHAGLLVQVCERGRERGQTGGPGLPIGDGESRVGVRWKQGDVALIHAWMVRAELGAARTPQK